MTTATAPALPDVCATRARAIAARAAAAGIAPTIWPATYSDADKLRAVAYATGWDAHAASEYPRPTLADAANVAALAPEHADTVWHHAAGATILGGYCCGTPASHRDALVALAQTIRPTED